MEADNFLRNYIFMYLCIFRRILEAKNNLLIEGQEKMMKKMEEILEKCLSIDDVNVNNTLYEPLQGFPLKTVKEFKEMESDANRSERKKLVSIF